MQVAPYLHFDGTCREAFQFYAETLGGQVVMSMTYGESPEPTHCPEDAKDRAMHMSLAVGDWQIMGSDMPPGMPAATPAGFSVMLSPATADEAERIYRALQQGGTIRMPLQETFWADRFGMLVDRFGIPWMVSCNKPL